MHFLFLLINSYWFSVDMATCIKISKSLTATLIHALRDPHKALTQHYGAVQGISALGTSAVGPVQSSVRLNFIEYWNIRWHFFVDHQIRLLLLPNLETYMRHLDPELQLEKQRNAKKRKEAWRVYGALLVSFLVLNQYRVHFRNIVWFNCLHRYTFT